MSNLDLFTFAVGVSRLSIDVQDMAFEEDRERRHEQNIRTIGKHESAEDCTFEDCRCERFVEPIESMD